MPAENRHSDISSLNWEEFFGSSNSDDLLPCLLNVYDSIAAARKLNSSRISDEDAETDETETADGEAKNDESTVTTVTSKSSTPSRMVWCQFRDVSTPQSDSGLRPRSAISVVSMSSRSSLSSSRSASSSNSVNPDTEETLDQRTTCSNEADDAANKSLDSLVEIEDTCGNQTKDTTTTQPRTSYATSSQYSEDSGIYSSLMRSESLHERSWFCTDSEDFSYTNRVAVEILETELVYVNDLQQIITGYLDEWRNDCNCPLSSDQINDLFGNIEEIYNFNRCFLWELEQCGLDPVKIAGCFVENNSNFSIYAVYCTHYPRSMTVLTDLMRQEKTAHIFRERQISLHHTLPLGSYLLKPVQRILKYHLLLQNMVKHTSPDAVGYSDITVALSTMTGIAHHINTMKRRHEHAIRVQEVQSLLTGWQGPDLTTFGELYAEGSFRISGAKALRHIFLFEHMLLVTKKKEGGILNYKTHILCSNLMLVECIPKELLSFQIIPFDNPRMQFTVHARSLEEKRHWTLELKRVILENYNVDIPSHARQLVMELGQIQLSDDVAVEKISSKKQHTPEYLQRRRGDKGKKSKMRSRLLPLFRKSDILLNNKMRSKLKKNQFVSEGSIFSDTSVNSDESYGNDASPQNLSQTSEDLSHHCDQMTRTLEDISKLSCGGDDGVDRSSETGSRDDLTESASTISGCGDSEADESTSSYQQKEKLIEEIIGQLLIASQKFQKAIKDHEHSMRSKRAAKTKTETYRSKSNFDTEDETEDEYSESGVLRYSKESANADSERNDSWTALNTSSESLSASLNVLIPTSPNIWLRQQREHLATPQKKADSLPRTFQVTAADEQWRANRPKTIASDKPTRVKNMKERYDNEDIVANNCFLKRREIAGSLVSLNTTNVHPECKFYRTSVARMTFRKMVYTMGAKLLTKRGKSERFYKLDHDLPKKNVSAAVASVIESQRQVPVYRQGSSDLGARIANGKEISDYADPKVLFPTITPSKKAASLLGIRASPTKQEQADADTARSRKDSGSDCSAESFYERQFEEVEAEFENAIRETSILADSVNAERAQEISESFRKYSQINVNISVHKAIRIPPPVPIKPVALKRRSKNITSHDRLSANSTECSLPTRGWVKQVVDRFQAID